jgi:hypothetical protein
MRLPSQLSTDQVAEQAGHLHAKNQGATVNLYFGDMGGQTLYAVSLYPERTLRVRGAVVSQSRLKQYLQRNGDLLQDPRNSLGLWYSPRRNTTFVDVSATLSDRAQAEAIANEYNQISIFDLARFEEISTGGTGTKQHDTPSEAERLSLLPPRPTP